MSLNVVPNLDLVLGAKIEVCGFEMTGDELEVKRGGGAGDLEGDDDVIVIMDFTMTPELEEKWILFNMLCDGWLLLARSNV